MANYQSLKSTISQNIKQNGNQNITGNLLQQVLTSMVNSLGSKYQFVGVATPSLNPGTPDYNVAYLCGPGTYANFGNKTVAAGHLGVLRYNGSWAVDTIELPSSGGENYFETINNAASLKSSFTAGLTTPQGNITAPAGVVFGKSTGKITVGTGGDFNTLSDALAFASKFSRIFANVGGQLTIELKTSFSVAEQLVIDGIDLSYINITRESYTPPQPTTSNKRAYLNGTQSYPTVFVNLNDGDIFISLLNGAKGPRISCIFSATKSKNITGLFLESGSQIVIDAFCGLVDFRGMVVASGGSIVNASDAIFKGGNNYVSNIKAEKGAIVDANGGMFSRDDGGIVLESRDGANIIADGFVLKEDDVALKMMLYAEDGKIVSKSIDLIDTEIEAYSVAGEISIGAISAIISATVEHGGIIRVVDGTAIPTVGTLNTISADGIIFG